MKTHAGKTQENKSQAAANRFAEKRISSEAGFQFVDERPEAAAQRKMQAMVDNSPRVKKTAQLMEPIKNHFTPNPILEKENKSNEKQGSVQRLIAPITQDLDWGHIQECWALKQKHGDDIVTYEKADLSKMEEGEKLFLVGHGEEESGDIAEKDVETLANELTEKGIQPHIDSIRLMSCYSGKGDDESYAAKLAEKMDWKYTVSGFKSSSVTDKSGVKSSQRETVELDEEYDDIIKKYETEIAEATVISDKVQKDVASVDADDEAIILSAQEEIWAIAEKLFEELYAFNEKARMSAEEGEYTAEKKEPETDT